MSSVVSWQGFDFFFFCMCICVSKAQEFPRIFVCVVISEIFRNSKYMTSRIVVIFFIFI